LDIGAAVVTDGGSLAADYIIHAVVSSPTKPITGLGMDTAARILIDTIFRCRTATYPMEVCIVVGSKEEESMVNAFLRSRQAYES
jgi:O-acetyl-ADP-ribose deacetylase (regulator of RNase III)